MIKKKQLALQKATLKNENDENSNKLNYVPNEFDNVCRPKGQCKTGRRTICAPAIAVVTWTRNYKRYVDIYYFLCEFQLKRRLMKQASELNSKDSALAERNEQIVAMKAGNAKLEKQVEIQIYDDKHNALF